MSDLDKAFVEFKTHTWMLPKVKLKNLRETMRTKYRNRNKTFS